MVYFCHKRVCMFSIWREALGTYVPRLLTKCFSTFGKFGDWSWGLCYLFCSGPTDYSRLSQQCLMWDVAAQDKWYQWEGYVVWKLWTYLGRTILCPRLRIDKSVLGIHSQQQAGVLLLEVISRENQSQLRNSFEAQKKPLKLAFPEITWLIVIIIAKMLLLKILPNSGSLQLKQPKHVQFYAFSATVY